MQTVGNPEDVASLAHSVHRRGAPAAVVFMVKNDACGFCAHMRPIVERAAQQVRPDVATFVVDNDVAAAVHGNLLPTDAGVPVLYAFTAGPKPRDGSGRSRSRRSRSRATTVRSAPLLGAVPAADVAAFFRQAQQRARDAS